MAKESERPLRLTALGKQPFYIGAMYDATNHQVVQGLCPWNRSTLERLTAIQDIPSTDFKFTSGNDLRKKLDTLDVSASIALSLLSGKIQVTGSASYLRHNNSEDTNQSLTLHHRTTTKFLYMDTSALQNLDDRQILKTIKATHVVTGIAYGAECKLVFESEHGTVDSDTKIEGEVNVKATFGKKFKLDAKAKIESSEFDDIKHNMTRVSFYGDYNLPELPTHFDAAMRIYENLQEYLRDGDDMALGKPKTVYCYPICKLDNDAMKLVAEVSDNLVDRAMDMLEIIEKQRETMFKISEDKRLTIFHPGLTNECKCAVSQIDTYMPKYKEELSEKLSKIRGTGKGEENLAKLLITFNNSPFADVRLGAWLLQRRQETVIARAYMDAFQKSGFTIGKNDINTAQLSQSTDGIFVRCRLAISRDPKDSSQLRAMEQYNNKEDVEEIVDEMMWYEKSEVRTEVLCKLQSIKRYVKTNKGFAPEGKPLNIGVGFEFVRVNTEPENPNRPPRDVFFVKSYFAGQVKPFLPLSVPRGLYLEHIEDQRIPFLILARFDIYKGEPEYLIHIVFRVIGKSHKSTDPAKREKEAKKAKAVAKSGKVAPGAKTDSFGKSIWDTLIDQQLGAFTKLPPAEGELMDTYEKKFPFKNQNLPIIPGKYYEVRAFLENELGRSEFSEPCLFAVAGKPLNPEDIELENSVCLAEKNSQLTAKKESRDITVKVQKPKAEIVSLKPFFWNATTSTNGVLPVAIPDSTGGSTVLYGTVDFANPDSPRVAPLIGGSMIYKPSGMVARTSTAECKDAKMVCMPRDSTIVLYNDASKYANMIPMSALKIPFEGSNDEPGEAVEDKDPFFVIAPQATAPSQNMVFNVYPGQDGVLIQATVLSATEIVSSMSLFYWVIGEHAVGGSEYQYKRARAHFMRQAQALEPGRLPPFPLRKGGIGHIMKSLGPTKCETYQVDTLTIGEKVPAKKASKAKSSSKTTSKSTKSSSKKTTSKSPKTSKSQKSSKSTRSSAKSTKSTKSKKGKK